MNKTIAFDITQANDPRRTGIGRVVEEQVRSILWLMENNRWPLGQLTLLSAWPFRLPEEVLEQLKSQHVNLVVLPLKSMYIYRLFRVSFWVLRNQPKLLFIPEPIYPGLLGKSKLAVMHYDLITQQSPKTVSRHIRFLYNTFLLPTLRKATHVGVDSEFVRQETAELLPGFLAKSEVLPIYLHAPIRTLQQTPQGIDPNQPFALFVGNLMPHKNIRRLLQAFEDWQQNSPEEFFPLYVVGRGRPEIDDLEPHLLQLVAKGTIRHFGYISDAELTWLFSNARFFAFPSLIEGYGLPIMESMSQGCPVLTAAGGATEETAGGAALLVDPKSHESILAGIRTLARDTDLRESLKQKGLAHAERFTREHHATRLLQFFQKALS